MKCPYCGSANYRRDPKFRKVMPLGRMLLRKHVCGECYASFVSFEKALTEDEMHKLADDLEQSDVA